MSSVLLAGFVILLVVNVPVSFALAIASLAALLFGGLPPALVGQKMTATLDSFILLAIPFFLLAGHLMARSGIARDIVDFANAIVGWMQGGLAHASIAAGTLMGGVTGAAVAEASSAGSVMIPEMKRNGYDGPFAAAVTASASTIAVVIPPSIPLIIFGVVTGVSVSRLFVAGVLPGILIAVVLMATAWLVSRHKNYPKGKRPTRAALWKATRASLWGLMMPFVIIGSIRYGIATPTEASVIAVVYSLVVGMVVYGTISWRDLPGIALESAVTTGIVVLMIAAATLYGLVITREQIPQEAARLILEVTSNPQLVLLLFLAVYFVAGMLLDLGASIIILVPVLWPLAQQIGVDPIHFGILTVVGLAIGLITPPVGASLFVTCGIARCNLMEGSRAALPFIIALTAVAIALIFIPQIATWLPSRMD